MSAPDGVVPVLANGWRNWQLSGVALFSAKLGASRSTRYPISTHGRKAASARRAGQLPCWREIFCMANRQTRNGRSKQPEGQYASLPYNMLKSPAWRSLGGSSVKVYFELHLRFHGLNNGDLSLGLDTAAKELGLGKSTVLRAFKELEEKGFLQLTNKGNWIRGHAATWAMTSKPFGKALRSDKWRDWIAPEKPAKTRKPYGAWKKGVSAKTMTDKTISRSQNET